MQMLNKTEQIANLQGKDHLERQTAIQDTLLYTDQPHIHPRDSEVMRGTTIRTKLDYIQPKVQRSKKINIIDERDAVHTATSNL